MNFIEHILEPTRLLLVWQGPEDSSRLRHTVAELVRQENGVVRFRYLPDTADFRNAQTEGFINFPAFRKIGQVYDLGVVDTFMRRLPPRTRGDYGQYLEQFRLRPTTGISDFGLLAYTGAKLPGDGFSLINPLDDVAVPCEVLIEVAGFRHATQLPLADLREGDPVSFAPEPENPRESSAVAILVGGQKIGYVPRQQAAALQKHCDAGAVQARVERVNGRPERPLIYLFTVLQPIASIQPLVHGAR